LSSAKRELAVLNSTLSGADVLPFQDRRRRLVDAQAARQQLQSEFDNSPHPYMLLDPGPGLRIVDINDAYAEATLIGRSDVVGRSLFEIFPDNPDNVLADGVSNLCTSLRTVAQTKVQSLRWIKQPVTFRKLRKKPLVALSSFPEFPSSSLP
jgi:PAS domain-containing protein